MIFSSSLSHLSLVAAVLATSQAFAETRVIDGDTILHRGERIRIWGLDCPERNTLAGLRATSQARILLEGNRVIISERKATDKYGRTVAIVLVQRVSRAEFFTLDFACQMIQSGACREYTRYSHNYYGRCKP